MNASSCTTLAVGCGIATCFTTASCQLRCCGWGPALVSNNLLMTQAYATAVDGPKWAGLDAATIAARVAAQVTADSASIRTAGGIYARSPVYGRNFC